MLTAAEGPPVVLYAAVNQTEQRIDQFTVIAFVFRADGTLKARHLAPGRRTLEPREAKYSTLVLWAAAVRPSASITAAIA